MNTYKAVLLSILLALLLMSSGKVFSECDHEHHQEHTPLEATELTHDDSLFHLSAEWTNHRGETLTLADFSGHPMIITMIYGNCETACPILVHDAHRTERALPEHLQAQVKVLVVSFDEQRDTPDALASYADQRDLDQDHWHFLHGEAADIRTLASLLGIRYRANQDGSFDHSNVVAVLDGNGQIAHRTEGLVRPVDAAVAALRQQTQKP
ncbi:protein SCO1/2 [Natronospira proteinivora]|uniref:Protein SCO1/2 n=1 Tax=Natronospira proteinivora TaxID=1807133 RepID=A0ABT1G7T7_9GAMM|nr:SCO family protein [Natronospira proteinivora]MCP1727291.1 protein SCO1/2 [Natronospira proteinivora]